MLNAIKEVICDNDYNKKLDNLNNEKISHKKDYQI